MNSQQLGKFSLPVEVVREQPELVAMAFQDMKFIPVKVELMYGGQFDYTGISDKFEEIERGMVALEYDVDIVVNQTGDDGPEEYHRVIVERMYTKIPSQDDGTGD
jgi:hypothetical protein